MVKLLMLFLSGIAVIVLLFAGPALYNSYRQHDEQSSWSRQSQDSSFGAEPNDGDGIERQDELRSTEHIHWINFGILGIAAIAVVCTGLLLRLGVERRVLATEVGGAHRTTALDLHVRHLRLHRRRRRRRLFVNYAILTTVLAIVVATVIATGLWIIERGTTAPGTTAYGLTDGPQRLTMPETERDRHEAEEMIRRSKEAHPTKYF